MMHLLRCLSFCAAVHNVEFVAHHLAGVENTSADALSRNNAMLFTTTLPQVPRVAIPRVVANLLVHVKPNCMGLTGVDDLVRSLLHGPEDSQTNKGSLYKSG